MPMPPTFIMQPAMQILFCTNAHYFQHLAVAAVSLAVNNQGQAINIHVMTTSQDSDNVQMLRDSLRPFRHVTLEVHFIAAQVLDNVFVDRHLTRESYLRFLAPDVLTCDRVLYLDCDLVVLDSLAVLWATDLGVKSTGAAPDFIWDSKGAGGAYLPALGLDDTDAYVNSGVLLLNLTLWRERNIAKRLMDFAFRHGPALKFHDQDALNVVLKDDIHRLDCRWNLQARMYRLGKRGFPVEYGKTRHARHNPAIIHFSTGHKPWLFRTRCPRKRHYYHYLAMTEWRDQLPPLTGSMQHAEYALDRLVAWFGGDYMASAEIIGRRTRALGGWGRRLLHHPDRQTPIRRKDQP